MHNVHTPERTPRSASILRKFRQAAIPLLLILTIAAFRLVELEKFPAYIHNDESAVPLYLVPEFIKPNPDHPLWGFNGYGGHGNLGPWLSSIPTILTGDNSLFNARIAAALSGVLSAVFFALALGITYGKRVGLLCLLAVAPFHLHLHYSRAGFTYIHTALAFGILSAVFVAFERRPSLQNAFLLGACIGLSIMTYSASYVYPAALAPGILVIFWSIYRKAQDKAKKIRQVLTLVGALACGFIAAIAPQVVFILIHGAPERSRLNSQLVFKLIPPELFQNGTTDWRGITSFLWDHFIRTIRFFTERDGAVQYGSPAGVCETFSGLLAIAGATILLVKALRLHAFSVFLLSTAVLTVIGSAMMLEASFSPHFIVFTLLIPGAIAVGCDGVLKLIRLRQPIVVAILATACAIPWSIWNVRYIEDVDSRKFNLNIWLLRLPIPARDNFVMANTTQLYADFHWPMYQLAFPNAKFVTIPSEKTRMAQLSNTMGTASANASLSEQVMQESFQIASAPEPAVLIISDEQQERFEKYLAEHQLKFTKFTHPKIPAKLFYVAK